VRRDAGWCSYEVVGKGKDYEVRKYEATKWATTEVKDVSLEEAERTGFRVSGHRPGSISSDLCGTALYIIPCAFRAPYVRPTLVVVLPSAGGLSVFSPLREIRVDKPARDRPLPCAPSRSDCSGTSPVPTMLPPPSP
jgi:hypothetical protein